MIIESGVIIFLGLMLLGFKLNPKTSLWLLGMPLALDAGVTVLAFAMHYGTFSGVMAAAVAGLMTSGFTSVARKAFGYIAGKTYTPGYYDLSAKYQLTKGVVTHGSVVSN